MEIRAYAKINLGLDILKKRDDGYHEVKMVMQNVDLYDVLTFRVTDDDIIEISTTDGNIPTDQNNLIWKATALLKEMYHVNKGVKIHLEKNIPVEAGMAGGSADCAATLIAINTLFHLNINKTDLMKIGKSLGADVPYCIMGGTALAEGIGEKLTKLPMPPNCHIIIAKPNIGVSTKFVYENLKADSLPYHPDIDGIIDDIHKKDLESMAHKLENVLETVTLKAYPIIEEIKNMMEENGAIKALMSGSGPTVFGIYDSLTVAEDTLKKLNELDYLSICCLTEFHQGNGI